MPGTGTGKTILVVEDEHDMRALLAFLLEKEGFHVVEAADAIEADRQWMRHPKIDLAIIDIWLPGMSGIDFAALLRFRRSDVKIIFISGMNPKPTEENFKQMSAPLLTKPF